jgi:hypothetical protein
VGAVHPARRFRRFSVDLSQSATPCSPCMDPTSGWFHPSRGQLRLPPSIGNAYLSRASNGTPGTRQIGSPRPRSPAMDNNAAGCRSNLAHRVPSAFGDSRILFGSSP